MISRPRKFAKKLFLPRGLCRVSVTNIVVFLSTFDWEFRTAC